MGPPGCNGHQNAEGACLGLLLYAAWKTGSKTFPFPNTELERNGVERYTKYRILRELERAGLIVVERQGRKAPLVTLIGL